MYYANHKTEKALARCRSFFKPENKQFTLLNRRILFYTCLLCACFCLENRVYCCYRLSNFELELAKVHYELANVRFVLPKKHSDRSLKRSRRTRIHSGLFYEHSRRTRIHSGLSYEHSRRTRIHSGLSYEHSRRARIHSGLSYEHSRRTRIHSGLSYVHSRRTRIHSDALNFQLQVPDFQLQVPNFQLQLLNFQLDPEAFIQCKSPEGLGGQVYSFNSKTNKQKTSKKFKTVYKTQTNPFKQILTLNY